MGTWAPQRRCTWHSWFPNRTAKTCVHTWRNMYVRTKGQNVMEAKGMEATCENIYQCQVIILHVLDCKSLSIGSITFCAKPNRLLPTLHIVDATRNLFIHSHYVEFCILCTFQRATWFWAFTVVYKWYLSSFRILCSISKKLLLTNFRRNVAWSTYAKQDKNLQSTWR